MKEQWKRLDNDAKLLLNVEEGRTVDVKFEVPTSSYNSNEINCYKRLLVLLRIFVLIAVLVFLSGSVVAWYSKNYQQPTLKTSSINLQHHASLHHEKANKLSFRDKVYEGSKEQMDGSKLNSASETAAYNYNISDEDMQPRPTVELDESSEKSSEHIQIEPVSLIEQTSTEISTDRIESEESENYSLESDNKELWRKLEGFLNVFKYVDKSFLIEELRSDKKIINNVKEIESRDQENIIKKKFVKLIALDDLHNDNSISDTNVAASTDKSDDKKEVLKLETKYSEAVEDFNIDNAALEEFAAELVNALDLDSQTSDSMLTDISEEKSKNIVNIIKQEPVHVSEEKKIIFKEDNIHGLESNFEKEEDSSEEHSRLQFRFDKSYKEPKINFNETSISKQLEEIQNKNIILKEASLEKYNKSKIEGSSISFDRVESEEKNQNRNEEINQIKDESVVQQEIDSQDTMNNGDEVSTTESIEQKEIISGENESSIEKEINSGETRDVNKLSNIEYSKYIEISNKLSHFIRDPLDLLIWYYQNKNDPDFISDNDKLKVYAAKLLFSSNIYEFNDDLNTILYVLRDKSYDAKQGLSSLNLYYILNRIFFKISLRNNHSLSAYQTSAALNYANVIDLKATYEVQQQQQTLVQMMRNVGKFEDLIKDNDKLPANNFEQLQPASYWQKAPERIYEPSGIDEVSDGHLEWIHEPIITAEITDEKYSNLKPAAGDNDYKNYLTQEATHEGTNHFSKERSPIEDKVENLAYYYPFLQEYSEYE